MQGKVLDHIAGRMHATTQTKNHCDPYERADITSNTFWDWQLNHVGSMYGVMDEVFKFAATFKEYPPRSTPPSFNPANIMEETLREMKAKRRLEQEFPVLGKPKTE